MNTHSGTTASTACLFVDRRLALTVRRAEPNRSHAYYTGKHTPGLP
uniref:Uncharacterized protein n=1 Tax=Anguilla anguilla TaxID=7936 RepID=A0A0E9QLC2_ANGAN